MKIIYEPTKYHVFAFYFDYEAEVVDLLKMLKDSFGWKKISFCTDDDKKRWVFSDKLFIDILRQKYPHISVDENVLEMVGENKKKTVSPSDIVEYVKNKKESDIKINNLKMELYPYQKVGVEFLVEARGRSIIADPPGVGKTAQALGYIQYMNFDRVLIVCPSTVKYSWSKEIEKWTKKDYVVIDDKTDITKIKPDTSIWIINYDLLVSRGKTSKVTISRLDQLLKVRFDLIVLDESHYIKNPSAGRTKAIRLLSQKIPHIVFLTGTPMLSKPAELFSTLNLLNPLEWSSYYGFTKRYCDGKQTQYGYQANGATNTQELHERIKKYYIRRDKQEILSQLPRKIHIPVPVKMPQDIERRYNKAENDFITYLLTESKKTKKEIQKTMMAEHLAQLNVLRNICSQGKIDTAIELIGNITNSGEKIVVFSSFIDTLNEVESRLKAGGVQSVMINGTISEDQRMVAIDSFQNDPNTQVFLGGIKSAGVGITLTAATNVLFIDFSWNPADHEQGEDRIHRPGAVSESVNIYQLIARDTIDLKLEELLQKKRKIICKVIDGEYTDTETDVNDSGSMADILIKDFKNNVMTHG